MNRKLDVGCLTLCLKLLLTALLIALFATAGFASAEEQRTVQVSDTLNVRDKPNGSKLGWLYPDDVVTVLEDSGGWSLVLCSIEDGQGWVKSEYLTNGARDLGTYTNQSGGRLRLRDGIDGKAIGWVKGSAALTVTAWASDADGVTWAFVGNGWVQGELLDSASSKK